MSISGSGLMELGMGMARHAVMDIADVEDRPNTNLDLSQPSRPWINHAQ